MLGNFSFGDYFKKEAIQWAWEYLLEWLHIPEKWLVVSVYEEDDEAAEIWQKLIGLPRDKIYAFGPGENFWPANVQTLGPNGPCGPCTEIFYDQGEEVGCRTPHCDPSCECPRYVEVWNLVFTQFDRQSDGSLVPLPRKNIDTGLGLERTAAVMQGVATNFDIDIFTPIIERLSSDLSQAYGKKEEIDRRLRRIADHIRAVTFTIAEGVLPSNEARGYVVRRLLRRAAMDARFLGSTGALFYQIVPTVVEVMKEAYPDLGQREKHIVQVIRSEEERFQETLQAGTRRLEERLEEMKERGETELPGEEAFRLYDTYGLPLETTQEICSQSDVIVDVEGFNKAMEAQRELARTASGLGGEIFESGVWSELKEKLPPTQFLGYQQLESQARIIALLKEDAAVQSASRGEKVVLVLDQTPFYGESGGQVGDSGVIQGENFLIEIEDTKIAAPFFLHYGKVTEGEAKRGSAVVAKVDEKRRLALARNHTATHLLHFALRQILGPHAQQAGALKTQERLRFDFTHPEALTADEIRQVEALVNEKIMENTPISTSEMNVDEAKDAGAVALFSEKYGEKARVVSVGDFSKELCGGTHLHSTGEVGLFKIIGEESIAAGVRRITALTGPAALHSINEEKKLLEEAATAVGAPVAQVLDRVKGLQDELKSLRKEKEQLQKSLIHYRAREIFAAAEEQEGAKIVVQRIDGVSLDGLRSYADVFREEGDSLAAVLGAATGGKVFLICLLTQDLVKKGLDAGKIVAEVAQVVGGGGGGRPTLAQAGGPEVKNLDKALDKARGILRSRLSTSNFSAS
jgi:alanyl-tRNA synthetase